MDPADNREFWFDSELHKPVDEKRVDYSSVEAVLSRRIRETQELGVLSLLRLDQILSAEKIEKIEQDLFTQISHHSEYDEPINECLRGEYTLTEKRWERLTAKLKEQLQPVVRLPQWEQQLIAPCQEPTVGHWEAMETVLFDRISRCDEQLSESWVSYESREEPATVSSLETAEELLDEHIGEIAAKPYWEQIIRCEEVPSFAHWENIEERLFSKLFSPQELDIKKQPFWHIINHYRALIRGVGVVGTTVGAVALAIVGYTTFNTSMRNLPTVVYQLEGKATDCFRMDKSVKGQCAMVTGGGATLVNSHGSIELRNHSRLNFNKLSQNRASYSVDFTSSDYEGDGLVSFFVHRRTQKQSFSVTTKDYRLEVKGTYFNVEADNHRRVATRVLEGCVRVTGGPFGDTVLYAGQSLRFDPVEKRYRIYSGGKVIDREKLEMIPAVEELLKYKVLSIQCQVPAAQVYINNIYQGTTPFTVRQPDGKHTIRICKDGYMTVDTSIFLSGTEENVVTLAFSPNAIETNNRIDEKHSIALKRTATRRKKHHENEITHADGAKTKVEELTNLYRNAQKAESENNWRKACRLYKKVFNDPNVSPLRREDALFSISRLEADNGKNVEVAKESFLTYLALFPSGTFAGESWLRLAELEFRTNPENAIQYYLKYFQLFPRHPRIAELKDRVGVIYLQQKRYAKAIDMFEQALANVVSSNDDELRNIASHLHRALLANGENQRAESIRVRYLVAGSQ